MYLISSLGQSSSMEIYGQRYFSSLIQNLSMINQKQTVQYKVIFLLQESSTTWRSTSIGPRQIDILYFLTRMWLNLPSGYACNFITLFNFYVNYNKAN